MTYVTKTSAALKAAVKTGPVSVSIQANLTPFYFYTGGIINTLDCGTAINHGVTVVGYGFSGT